MNIGPPKRVIEIRPATLPVPEVIPDPAPRGVPEPSTPAEAEPADSPGEPR